MNLTRLPLQNIYVLTFKFTKTKISFGSSFKGVAVEAQEPEPQGSRIFLYSVVLDPELEDKCK
jgi:hypothetical protein